MNIHTHTDFCNILPVAVAYCDDKPQLHRKHRLSTLPCKGENKSLRHDLNTQEGDRGSKHSLK